MIISYFNYYPYFLSIMFKVKRFSQFFFAFKNKKPFTKTIPALFNQTSQSKKTTRPLQTFLNFSHKNHVNPYKRFADGSIDSLKNEKQPITTYEDEKILAIFKEYELRKYSVKINGRYIKANEITDHLKKQGYQGDYIHTAKFSQNNTTPWSEIEKKEPLVLYKWLLKHLPEDPIEENHSLDEKTQQEGTAKIDCIKQTLDFLWKKSLANTDNLTNYPSSTKISDFFSTLKERGYKHEPISNVKAILQSKTVRMHP